MTMTRRQINQKYKENHRESISAQKIVYYQANKPHILMWVERNRLATKIYALDMLGGQCVKCGNNKIFQLEFDHIKPTRLSMARKTKFGGITGAHTPIQIVNGKEDLSNLQILCGSCHLEKTYRESASVNIAMRSLNKNPAQEVN